MPIPNAGTAVALLTTPSPAVDSALPRHSPYGYDPTKWICILYVTLFALATVIHAGQALRSRLWWLFVTACFAGVGEVIGWVARLESSDSPYSLNPFIIQITTTIIAPTPLIAASFIILGEIIQRMGPDYSRLNSKWYTIIFLSCDLIALIVQAVGGAKASIAVKQGNDPGPGGHIMLAGVVFQLAALVVYVALASEFLLRFAYDHPFNRATGAPARAEHVEKKIKFMIAGLALEAVFLFIRSIYRTAELTEGWRGKIITTETYFNVFDAAMIVLAMVTLSLFHPGYLLGHASAWKAHRSLSQEDQESDLGLKSISQ
ncbi:RTA1-domain-containing protein [Trametes punicea]|nr:RTA1-domain-containing protein [Trametes punicea]